MPIKRTPRCGDFGHNNRHGQPCHAYPLAGTIFCKQHSNGKTWEQRAAEGALRVALDEWGISRADYIDPGDTLLRLIAQSARRVQRYADAIESLIIAQEEADLPEPDQHDRPAELPGIDPALKVLLAPEYSVTKEGLRVYIGKQIAAITKLEADERDRLALWCQRAIAAGLEERRVKAAEQQGIQLAAVMRAFAEQIGLSAEQYARVPSALRAAVATVFGEKTAIEGVLVTEP